MTEIVAAARPDHPALIETLAQAFQTDPALSWILPDPEHRARALRGTRRRYTAVSKRGTGGRGR